MTKPIKREVFIFTVNFGDRSESWEVRETRTRRYYCYDNEGFCFDWSFMPDRAIQKLKQEAASRGGKAGMVGRQHRVIKPDLRKNKDRRSK